AVRPDHEDIELVRGARDRGHPAAGYCLASGNRPPSSPRPIGDIVIPGRGRHRAVVPHRKDVELLGVACHDRDRRIRPGDVVLDAPPPAPYPAVEVLIPPAPP